MFPTRLQTGLSPRPLVLSLIHHAQSLLHTDRDQIHAYYTTLGDGC